MALQASVNFQDFGGGGLSVNDAYICIDFFSIQKRYNGDVAGWSARLNLSVWTERAAKIDGMKPIFTDMIEATMPANFPDENIVAWLYQSLKQLRYPSAVDVLE